MMLRTHHGYINTDHCRQLRCRWNKEKPYESILTGEYSDGTIINELIAYSSWQDFESIVGYFPPLPSPPGYALLTYLFDILGQDPAHIVSQDPVIAWIFDNDMGFHRVFTPFGWPEDYGSFNAILCPDGKVIDPGNRIFDSLEAWTADMRANADAEIEKQREPKTAAKS